MAQENIPRAQTVPEFWNFAPEEHARKLAVALNQVQRGVTNNHFKVTLEANETETEVMFTPIRAGSAVQLTPASESAAIAIANGVIWVETENEKAIIHHDASAETGRIFHLTFNG